MNSQRLQRLVRLRKLVEDVESRELDSRRKGLAVAEAALDETHKSLSEIDAARSQVVRTPGDLVMVSQYEAHLARIAVQQKGVIVEREAEVETQRTVVQQAWQERRLMENVHGRAVTVEREERETVERRFLDAIALDGFARRRRTP